MEFEEVVREVSAIKPGRWVPVSWISSQGEDYTVNRDDGTVVTHTLTYVCEAYVRLNIHAENTKSAKARKIKPTSHTSSRKCWYEHDPAEGMPLSICQHKELTDKKYLQMFKSNKHDIRIKGIEPIRLRIIQDLGTDKEYEITPDSFKTEGTKTWSALVAMKEDHIEPIDVFVKPVEAILSIGGFYIVK